MINVTQTFFPPIEEYENQLCLPLYHGLQFEQIDRICSIIKF